MKIKKYKKKKRKTEGFKKNWGLFFFNCYLAAPRPVLGHYRGEGRGAHPMLITAYCIFYPRVTGSLIAGLGP